MSVKIENLSFAYGTHQVLKNISLEVGDGTLVNVLGPNGTGKSTLFRCILGLYTSYHGSIIVNGKDISKLNIRERAREMAFIPQSHKPVYDYDVEASNSLCSLRVRLRRMRTPSLWTNRLPLSTMAIRCVSCRACGS